MLTDALTRADTGTLLHDTIADVLDKHQPPCR